MSTLVAARVAQRDRLHPARHELGRRGHAGGRRVGRREVLALLALAVAGAGPPVVGLLLVREGGGGERDRGVVLGDPPDRRHRERRLEAVVPSSSRKRVYGGGWTFSKNQSLPVLEALPEPPSCSAWSSRRPAADRPPSRHRLALRVVIGQGVVREAVDEGTDGPGLDAAVDAHRDGPRLPGGGEQRPGVAGHLGEPDAVERQRRRPDVATRAEDDAIERSAVGVELAHRHEALEPAVAHVEVVRAPELHAGKDVARRRVDAHLEEVGLAARRLHPEDERPEPPLERRPHEQPVASPAEGDTCRAGTGPDGVDLEPARVAPSALQTALVDGLDHPVRRCGPRSSGRVTPRRGAMRMAARAE